MDEIIKYHSARIRIRFMALPKFGFFIGICMGYTYYNSISH